MLGDQWGTDDDKHLDYSNRPKVLPVFEPCPDGVAFPGYKLGKAYSFNGLQKHLGVSYLPEQDQRLKEFSQMRPQEIKPLVEEQQAHQQHYDQLYQRYRLERDLTPEQQDRFVLRRALNDGFEPDEAAAIIGWSGEQAETIRRAQGTSAAEDYVLDLTQNELLWVQRQEQQAREQDHGLER